MTIRQTTLLILAFIPMMLGTPTLAQDTVAPIELDEREQLMRERYQQMLDRNPFQERTFDQVYEGYLNNDGIDAWIEVLTPKAENDPPDINALLLLGQIYNRQFDTVKAIEVLEQAAGLGESRPQLNVLLGTLYYKTGQNEKASDLLQNAMDNLTDVDERTRVSRMLGSIHLRSGNPEEAISVWSSITESNPNEIFTQLELAEIYEDNRMWDKAVEVYRRIVELSQDDPYRRCRSLRSIAQCMIRLENYQDAISVLEEAMELVAPGNWLFEDLKIRLISVYQDLGDLSGLVTYLNEKLEQSPNDLEYRDLLAETYLRMAKFEDAETAYQFILERDPAKTVIYEKLISLYERMQNAGKQTEMLEKLIAAYPNEADYYRRLGEHFLRHGDAEQAKQSWVRWSETDESANRLADVAGWYESYEYMDEAIAAYRQAIGMKNSKEWSFRLAVLLYQKGEKDEALKVWQSVLNEESTAAEYAEVAAVLASNQFTDEPAQLLQKAIELEPDNYEFHLAYARDRMRNDDYETALKEFELLAATDDTEYFKEQGEKGRLDAFSEMGVLEEKQNEWEADLAATPNDVEKITRLSRLYQRAGQPEKSVALLERRRDIEPENPQYLYELAEMYTKEKRIDEAIDLYKQLAELDKNRARAYKKELLDIYLSVDLQDEAIAMAESIVDLAATDPEARLDLGQVYQLYNEPEKALQQYRYALRLAPDEPDYYRQYGEALIMQKQWGEAQNAYRKMLETTEEDDTRAGAVRNLALIYMQQNLLDDLINEFQRRIRNTPKRLAAYEELAAIYKEAGQIIRSVEILENGLEMVDDKEPALKRLIRESYEAQDFERVKSYYEQLLAMSGQPSAFEYERLGKIYAQLGDIEKALETWSQIVTQAPDDVKAQSQYAKILRDEGFNEEALAAMAKAVDMDEYDYKLRFEYAQFLAQNERPVEAMNELKTILKLGEQEEEKTEEGKEKKVKRLTRGQSNTNMNPYMFVYGMQMYSRAYSRGSWSGSFQSFRPQVISMMANLAQTSIGIESFLEEYKERQKKEPNNTELRHDMLLIYQAFNQYEDALQVVEELMELMPDDVELIQQAALLYSSQQKNPEAIALMEKMAETQPKFRMQALQGLIPLYIKNKEEEKAKELAQQLIDENPNDYTVIAMMSQIMMQQGMFDLAIQFIENADQIDPRYQPTIRRMAATIYQQKGDMEKALEAYKQVLLEDSSSRSGYLSPRRQMQVYVPELQNAMRGRIISRRGGQLPSNVVRNFDYAKSQALMQIVALQKTDDATDIIAELEQSAMKYGNAVSAAEQNQSWETAKMLVAKYINDNETGKARELLQHFKDNGMDSVEWYNLSIFIAEQAQDYDTMKTLYDELDGLYPAKSREISKAKVHTAILGQQYEQAAEYIRDLNQRRIPPAELVLMIQNLEQAGKSDLAKELLEEHVNEVSRNSQALALLAKLYAGSSEYDKAIELALEAWERKSQGRSSNAIYSSGGVVYYVNSGSRNSPDALLRELNQYHVSAGKSDKLIAYFQEKLEKQPGSVQLHENLAQIYILNQKRDEAIEVYKELVQKRPHLMSAKMSMADLYRQQGKTAEAKEIYEDLLKTNPSAYTRISWQLRDIYQQMGKGKELAEMEDEMAKKATNPDQVRNLAQQYLSRGDYENAVELFRKAIKLNPMDSYLNRQLADALVQLGKHDEALVVYRDWLESPLMQANSFVDHNTINKMVGLYRATGKLNELEEKVKADLAKNPIDKMALGIQSHLDKWNKQFDKVVMYHIAQLKAGQSPYSMNELREIIEIRGNVDDIVAKLDETNQLQNMNDYNTLARMYMSAGEPEKAYEMVIKFVDQQSQYSTQGYEIREGLNNIMQFGMWDKAEAFMEKYGKRMQEDWVRNECDRIIASAYVKNGLFQDYVEKAMNDGAVSAQDMKLIQRIAQEYRNNQQTNKQRELYIKLQKLDPENKDLKNQLAQLHAQNQDYGSAAELMKSLVDDDPNNAEYRRTYADYLYNAGKPDEAVGMIEAWCDENPIEERFRALANINKRTGDELAVLGALQKALEHADASKKEDIVIEIAEYKAQLGDVSGAEKPLKDYFESRQDQNAFQRYLQFLTQYGMYEKAYDFFIEQKDGGFLDRYRNAQITGLCIRESDYTTPVDVAWQFARYSDRYNRDYYSRNVEREYQMRGKVEYYLDAFKKKVESETPPSVPMLQSLADVYTENGYLDEALQTYDKVLKSNPYNRDVTKAKAQALLKRGKTEEAVKTIEGMKGATTLLEEIENTIASAKIYFDAGETKQAEAVLDKLSQWATGGKSINQIAALYFEQKMYEKAAPLFEEASRSLFDYQSGQILSHLGKCYAQLGETKKAVKAWKDAASKPHNYSNLQSELYWLQQEGLHKTVVAVLQNRIEQGEQDTNLYYQLADSLIQLEQTDEALKVCYDAAQLMKPYYRNNPGIRFADLLIQNDLTEAYLTNFYQDQKTHDDLILLRLFERLTKEQKDLADRFASVIELADDAEPETILAYIRGLDTFRDEEHLIPYYQAIIKHPKSNTFQKTNAAFTLLRINKQEETKQQIKKWFQQNPGVFIKNEHLFKNLTGIYDSSTIDEVMKQVDEYCLFDSHKLFYHAVADIHLAATDEALVKMEKIIDMPNVSSQQLNTIASTFKTCEQTKQAIQTYRRLTQPGFQIRTKFDALRQLSELYLKQQDWNNAVLSYAEMYPFGENHGTTEVQDMIFDALNEDTRAAIQEAFLHAINLDPSHDRASELAGIFIEMMEAKQWDVDVSTVTSALTDRESAEWREWNELIETWSIAGPFEAEGRQKIDMEYPVEKALFGKENAAASDVEWKEVTPVDSFGWIEMDRVFDLDINREVNNKVAYAKTEIESPEDRYVYFSLGSDDWVKIWVNGKEVHKNTASRSGFLNQDRFGAQLQKGTNTIVIKLGNNSQDWRFALRLDQGGNGIKIALN